MHTKIQIRPYHFVPATTPVVLRATQDLNDNGIPDWLEGDMKGNGIPDYQELN